MILNTKIVLLTLIVIVVYWKGYGYVGGDLNLRVRSRDLKPNIKN